MKEAFSERFNIARQRKGYSLQDIADKLGDISKQALHKYEQGRAHPDNSSLFRISEILNVTPDYFLRPVVIRLQSPNVDFRKRVRLPKAEEGRILAESADYFERYVETEQLMGVRIRFKSPIGKTEVSTPTDVEAVAKRLRVEMNLGLDPIANAVGLLEDLGIKCFSLMTTEEFDGLTAKIDNEQEGDHIGVVISTYFDVVRQRFTACHELAHQILLFPPSITDRDREGLCHYFAGALLLPGERLIQILSPKRKTLSVYELADIKMRFGLSMQAVLRRARDLGIISNSAFTGLSIYFTKQGWRKKEPYKYVGHERADRFQRLLHRGVSERIITEAKAALLSGQTVVEFRQSATAM